MNRQRLFSFVTAMIVALIPCVLNAADPNPFTDATGTTFELTMPQNGHVTIVVYDILGKRIKQLLDADKEVGVYPVHWDGKDEGGTSVPPGAYVAVLYSKGVVIKSVKVIKVKA